jgi:ATP-dependent DNA ligase
MPLPLGFVPPCLPTKAPQPPTGDAGLHEIKHDGFRVIARKDGERMWLHSRPGKDLTDRFTLIVEAMFAVHQWPPSCSEGLPPPRTAFPNRFVSRSLM